LVGKEFLEEVWSRQREGFACLAYRPNDGKWREYLFHYPREWDRVDDLPDDGDLYFCPNTFEDAVRQKELTLPSIWLYQDLDEITPLECPMFPTLWWETSPARYQGMWLLDSHMKRARHERLNRALNRASNADPGTWNLTRMLRVPGSWNGKRDCWVSQAYDDVPVLA
jgi:hypothetical protein